MKHTKIDADAQHKKHLALLAKSLLTKSYPVKFRMRNFSRGDDGCIEPTEVHKCGTACCAAGHAPLVKGLPKPSSIDIWEYYLPRVFGSYYYGRAFIFLFDTAWCDIKSQFAARAFLVLTEGVPDDYSVRTSRYPVPKPSAFNQWIK